MTYCVKNYKTAKALREDFKAGVVIEVFEPGVGRLPQEGRVFLEGPHYPMPHRWYLGADIKNGVIVKLDK